MLTLKETLDHHKIKIIPDFASTKMQREGSQWLRCYELAGLQFVYFGCYRSGLNEVWKSDDSHLSPEEKKTLTSQFKKWQAEMGKEREAEQIRMKLHVQEVWPKFIDRGTTDYLNRKLVPELFGCKLDMNDHGAFLLVPARDIFGEQWNYQRIYNQKLSAGDKFFLAGARIDGLFHTFGELSEERTIYIAEGFATAATIYQALNREQPVVSAFNAGNILPVALAIRSKFPRAQFVFCADDDHAVRRASGEPWNPGLEYAYSARDKLGGEVRSPVFKERGVFTDFNDLHASEGIGVVREQLLSATSSGASQPLAVGAFTEKRVAQAMLEVCGEDLVRQDKSLFRFTGTHWVELESYDIDQLKNQINALCGDKLDNKKNNSIYNTFFRYIPHVPADVNLFLPNPKVANFLDGTLTLNEDYKSTIHCLSFREHRREDYLNWVIPFNHNCDRSLKNSLFEAVLDETLKGNPDAEGMTRLLKQMGGSMLVAAYSQVFFLHGVSGARKSTIVLTLKKLVAEQNCSAVQPADMVGFMIEPMMGKLVNIHTDIDEGVALPRGFIKRFEDETPVEINRKGKTAMKSRIARIHAFCCNELPPNFEGVSKALFRRLSMLHFTNDLTNGADDRQLGSVIKHYENVIFAAGYEGILNFCLEGLEDLVRSGGKFYQPASSLAGVKTWQMQRDPIGLFLGEIFADEITDVNTKLKSDEKGRIQSTLFWETFKNWHKESFERPSPISKQMFFSGLRQRGYVVRHHKDGWFVSGLTQRETSSGVC